MPLDKPTLWWERARDLFERARASWMPDHEAQSFRSAIRQRVFATIEAERRWGAGPASGAGSSVESTAVCRKIVLEAVQRTGATTLLDAPCGDLTWMPLVWEAAPALRYVGADIVPTLIEGHRARFPHHTFHTLDFVSDPLPPCDLIVCRDALQHLPVADIQAALRNFSASGARWLLTSTHLRRTGWKNGRACRTGQCRDRNLMLPPFDLPDPVVIWAERDRAHKFLGLWSLPLER